MARHRKSVDEVGHAHEVTFTCYRRFPFLKAERTCQWLAEAIDTARTEHSFLLWAYVFMPDHAHVILLPTSEEHPISSILKAIKAPVGRQGVEFLEANAPQWLPKITRQRGGVAGVDQREPPENAIDRIGIVIPFCMRIREFRS